MNLFGYLAERERIEQGATPGRWEWEDESLIGPPGSFDNSDDPEYSDRASVLQDVDGFERASDTDRAFIIDARRAVPTLIAMVREATEALREMQRLNSAQLHADPEDALAAIWTYGVSALARLDAMATEDAT